MRVLIQLGSCAASWPENTTPIQRLKAVRSYFDKVVLVDTAEHGTPFVSLTEYVSVKNFSIKSVGRILEKFSNDEIVVWFGPSSRLSLIILFLRFSVKFNFVLDLYDHENLSSGIARARGFKLRAFKYRVLENFTFLAARRADILVSAISETRYEDLPNRIKAINGVAGQTLDEICDTASSSPEALEDRISVCYVGLTSKERTPVLREIASANYCRPLDILLIGDSEPDFVATLRKVAEQHGIVRIKELGFLPWEDAMRKVAAADICLYVFPTRPELDCVYPIKMGEYMKLGKPVVATDSTAIREVFSDCSGVLRCTIAEPQEWVNSLDALCSSATLRKELGDLNKLYAQDRLDWSYTQAPLLQRLSQLFS